MLIEKLIVKKTKPEHKTIRNIKFNLKGLNLIVDNTSDIAKDSGNNVGKTTAVKIIDLCLGAKSVKVLYFDDDTKTENTKIKKFLNDNKVEAELILIDTRNNKKVSIVRPLYNNGKRKINGEVHTRKEYEDKLKSILFDLKEPYPTLRQLMPKFVRVNENTSENMIKFLPNSTTKDTYDTIYLFLFRILDNKLLSRKDTLSTELKECKKRLKLYEEDDNISSIDNLKQRKELIENDLNILTSKRKNLDYMESYKEELQKKRQLATSIKNLEEQAQLLDFDINLINKNIKKLNNEKSNINVNQIRNIYNEAKAYINNISKTFNDVVKFHNTMIQNRIDFITEQLEIKKEELKKIIKYRNILLEKKKKITIDILDEGLLDELNVLNTKIESLNVEKGEINQSIKILEGVEKEIKSLENEIKIIQMQMNPDSVLKKISKFNAYFSDYCERLYGEKYLFVYNSNWKEQRKFPVSLDYFKGNVGTGMKKGVIVAFDLAYMKYAEETGITAPQFVIHDRLENTHINQLKTIFNLCQNINGQYIVPILRERVDKVDAALIEQAKILELSTDDKFFRI